MNDNTILIIAEHDGRVLHPATARSAACAAAIGGSVTVAVFAAEPAAVAAQAAKLAGIGRVLAIADAVFAHPLAAVLAPEIVHLAKGYSHVLAPSTTFGKDLLPRVAALLGVNQVSDVMEVLGPRRFRRPIYAGNALIEVTVPEDLKVVATVRTASWPAAGEQNDPAPLETLARGGAKVTHTRFIALESGGGQGPDLQTARIVVAGGRALGSKEHFALIYNLAAKLNAAVGASRAAVDAGYVPNELQVGQTGKIIAPELYFAFGISGAIQHLTGIKDAGTIVAVNKDAEAPIFEVADLGLAGDLFKVIPELEQAL